MRVTGPAQPERLLLDIVDILTQLRIPHAVVGAFAVSYYGVPRSTTDADVAVWLTGTGKTPQNVAQYIAQLGYRAEVRHGDSEDPISKVILVEDAHENRVDMLTGIRGMDPARLTDL